VPDAEERAYNEILLAIVTQKYAPGDHLIESKVAEDLNMSRTPVRNVFKKLIANGMLEYQRGAGYRIPVLTPSDMESVFMTRCVLEEQAAQFAAKRATLVEIERLQNLLQMEREFYVSGDAAKYTAANESLHLGIAALSKNSYLERFISQTFWRSELYIFFFDRFYFKEGFQTQKPLRDPAESQSCREHEDLLDAIASRDQNRAAEAMRRHVMSTYWTMTKQTSQ
jgi:DNA-binding GntR family transcriptional regulator